MNWLPFSDKHKEYILGSRDCKYNVAEGAVRSGKSIDNCIIFALNIEYSKDKIHLCSGTSLATAKMNIMECNGFGLLYLFSGRCRAGKYKDNDCLYINTKTGEKIVIFVGGGKADSYKKILGYSIGIWYATEVNEHYDCEDSKTSFIKVALARQLAAQDPKVIWDLNPSDPNAPIYKEYIDKWKENSIEGGYNYQHFNIFDNQAITEDRKKEIISLYDEGSIFYQRDILGLRIVATGRIYQEFKDHHIIKMQDWVNSDMRNQLKFISIGVDFGGNGSAHSFNATGFTHQFKNIITIKQRRIAERIDDKTLIEEFIKFINELKIEYPGVNIIDIRCDSAEQTLIAGFERALRENNIGIPISNAIKGKILDRIRFYCKMFSTNKYYILECCEPLIKAFQTAIWDKDKTDTRLDNGSTDIDSLDAQEYSTEPYQSVLIQIN